jgi:ribonuclease R
MLLANRSVATFIAEKGKHLEIPFPYRVHDEPDPDKMANLATFAAQFGVELNLSNPKAISKSYNRLRKLAAERKELAVLSPLAIRTMAKAEYTTENIGHYGLAFDNYAHFTSPIRRYADVLVHRILEKNLGKTEYRVDKEYLEAHCKHISERERAAVKAERESTSYFQVLFIKDHIGEVFDGTVNGVIERGVFVQLTDNYCEGFVPFETMDDRFSLGPNRLIATGKHTGKKLQMGTPVRVQIVNADLDNRRIEMALLNDDEDQPRPTSRQRSNSGSQAKSRKKPTRKPSNRKVKASANGQAKGNS